MPPIKVSTGYLTPQAKRRKQPLSQAHHSESKNSRNVSSESGSLELFQKLLEDPVSKKMVLQFLDSHKDAIKQYKNDEAKKQANSPVGKVKKTVLCESPTALFRRRALEQMEKGSSKSPDVNSVRSESRHSEASRSSSRQSAISSDRSSPVVQFDKIMDGVVAYVEIKSKGQDRSDGAKAILRSMGATIRDSFTKDVTHVVYKDGSFKTYQKAKLMKVHMVSILWVEFSRKSQFRQKESQYPPISAESNISSVCSQMHKEYEEIIREEYRQRIINGNPLPSTQTLRDRRRTLMTTSSSSASFLSATSKLTDHLLNTQDSADKEVEEITQKTATCNFLATPNIDEVVILNSSDEVSDAGATINAKIVNQKTKDNIFANVMKSLENIKDLSSSDMDFTCTDTSKSLISNVSDRRQTQLKMLNSNSRKTLSSVRTRRKSVQLGNSESLLLSNSFAGVSNVPCDMSEKSDELGKHNTKNVTNRKKRNISDNSKRVCPNPIALLAKSNITSSSAGKPEEANLLDTPITKNVTSRKRKNISTLSLPPDMSESNGEKHKSSPDKTVSSLDSSSKSKTSSLCESNNKDQDMPVLQILSKNAVSANKAPSTETALSSLRLSEQEKSLITSKKADSKSSSKSIETVMSSLKLSEKGKSLSSNVSSKLSYPTTSTKSVDTVMSSLKLSERSKSLSTNMSSLQIPDPKGAPSEETSVNNKSKRSYGSEDPVLLDSSYIEQALQILESPAVDCVTPKKSGSSTRSISKTPDKTSEMVANNIRRRKISLRSSSKVLEHTTGQRLESEEKRTKEINNTSDFGNKARTLDDTSFCSRGSSNICNDSTCERCYGILTDEDDSELVAKPTKKLKMKSNLLKETVQGKNVTLRDKSSCNKGNNNICNDSMCKECRDMLTDDEESEIIAKSPKEPNRKLSSQKKKVQENAPSTEKGNKSNKGREADQLKQTEERRCSLRKHNVENKEKTQKPIQNDLDPKKNSVRGGDNTVSSDDTDNSEKKRKKLRKLYDPNESLKSVGDLDEIEREEKRKQALISKTRKSMAAVLVPLFPCRNEQEGKEADTTDIDLELNALPKTSKRKKKDIQVKQIEYNSSQDEQRDLLDEVLKKKQKKINTTLKKASESPNKRDILKTPSQKQNFKVPSQITSRRCSLRLASQKEETAKLAKSPKKTCTFPITPIKRRSTLDFQSVNVRTKTPFKTPRINKSKIPTIVCTKLHKNDVLLFGQIVKKLGGFTIEDEVSSKTTHLVAGEPKRTLNMLRAVSRGCWVLRFDWVLKSLEAGNWLREEDFEETEFANVVQQARIQRQAFGPKFTLDVFESCGPIFVARGTNPRCSDLQELITLCQGKVVNCHRMAKIVVGEYVEDDELTCVTENWVLDCVTLNKKVSFKRKYRIEKPVLPGGGRLSTIV